MANHRATTTIIIDKSHPKKDGLCAVSIMITFERKKKYYATPISLTPSDFEKTQGKKPGIRYKPIALKLQDYEKKAADVIKDLPIFTWALFEKYYLKNRGAKDSLSIAFAEYAKQLREDDRIGTAVSYECASKSLSKFHPDARFADVTISFLKGYEKWMLTSGNSIATVGIYLRSLRTLINNGINEGTLSRDTYPFGKNKYEIPTASNAKKALNENDVAKIYEYKPEPGNCADMAKNYWLFLYLANGMNVKDMCLLKYENIKGDVLEFQRAKTIRTKRKVKAIQVPLTIYLKDIIQNWGNSNKDSNTYIFPVLGASISAVRERQLIQQLTHVINDHMKIIAKELKIDSPCTTYGARHSYATILQRAGTPISEISEALGHTSIGTTAAYLNGFSLEQKKLSQKHLTASFKNPLKAVG